MITTEHGTRYAWADSSAIASERSKGKAFH